jgi:VanZ family protein
VGLGGAVWFAANSAAIGLAGVDMLHVGVLVCVCYDVFDTAHQQCMVFRNKSVTDTNPQVLFQKHSCMPVG